MAKVKYYTGAWAHKEIEDASDFGITPPYEASSKKEALDLLKDHLEELMSRTGWDTTKFKLWVFPLNMSEAKKFKVTAIEPSSEPTEVEPGSLKA